MSVPVRLQNLHKRFGDVRAVDGVSLTVPGGELCFLLGPSGCGKTTLLRMLAGFVTPDAGSIAFGDREVTGLPPERRDAGMVFQGYALWPHLTVRGNVAFGLAVRRVPRAEARRRVDDALAAVALTDRADRRIAQLSGGQQQRVALARALVIRPAVLLLDEPLSNLDAKLRQNMRQNIRDVAKHAGITTLYVTHDRDEALGMADRVALFRDGKLVQSGPPRAVYRRPADRFAADFLGDSNFLPATVRTAAGAWLELDTPAGRLVAAAPADDHDAPRPRPGDAVTCSLRPEALRLVRDPPASGSLAPAGPAPANVLSAVRVGGTFLGPTAVHRVRVRVAGASDHDDARAPELNVLELHPAPQPPRPDASVRLSVEPDDVVVLPAGPS